MGTYGVSVEGQKQIIEKKEKCHKRKSAKSVENKWRKRRSQRMRSAWRNAVSDTCAYGARGGEHRHRHQSARFVILYLRGNGTWRYTCSVSTQRYVCFLHFVSHSWNVCFSTETLSSDSEPFKLLSAVSPLGFRKKQGKLTEKNRALKPPKTGENRANQGAKNRKTGTFSRHTSVYM